MKTEVKKVPGTIADKVTGPALSREGCPGVIRVESNTESTLRRSPRIELKRARSRPNGVSSCVDVRPEAAWVENS